MRTYRIGSIAHGLLYLTLVASITLRTPVPLPTDHNVFERIAPVGFWAATLTVLSFLLIITACVLPSYLVSAHVAAAAITAAYAVANLGTDISNDTGWQLASVLGALFVSHIMIIKLRPLSVL